MAVVAAWDCTSAAATTEDGVTAANLTFGSDVSADPWTGYVDVPVGTFGMAPNTGVGETAATYDYTTYLCYVDVTFTIPAGVTFDPVSLSLDVTRGGSNGVRGLAVRSSSDSYASELFAVDIPTSIVRPSYTTYSVDLAGLSSALTGQQTLRIYTWSPFQNSTVEFDNIEVDGTLTLPSGGAVQAPLPVVAAVGTFTPVQTQQTGSMASWSFTGNLQPDDANVLGVTPGAATFGADVREDANFSPLDWDGDTSQPWIGAAQPGVIAVTAESGKAGTTSANYTTRSVYVDLPVTVAAGTKLQLDTVRVRATRGHWQSPMGMAVRTSVDSYATEAASVEVGSSPQAFQTFDLTNQGFVTNAEDETVTVRLWVWTPFFSSALVIDSVTLIGSVTTAGDVPVPQTGGVFVRTDEPNSDPQELPLRVFARISGVETPVDVFARIGGTETLVLAAPRTDPSFTLTATPADNQVTVSWPNVPSAAGGYYVARNGTDINGTGAWSDTVAQGTTQQVFSNLRSLTTYTFTVRALDGSGATIYEEQIAATTTGTQPPPPPPPPPPSGGLQPGAALLYQGDSGLPWNTALSGSWGSNKRSAWEAWLGKRVDGFELFPGRATTTTMEWIPSELVAMRGYKVITLPAQPQGPNKNLDNTAGAAGQYNTFWRNYGSKLVSLGMNTNRTIIRVNHEPNPSSYAWHPWHWGAGGPQIGVQRFRAAVINMARNVKATAPDILISLNHARGNFDTSYTGGLTWAQCVDPLMTERTADGSRFLFDLVTQDSYNNSPGVTPNGVDPGEAGRLANWYTQTNGVNSATPPGRSQNFGIPCRGTCYAFCEYWTAQRGSPVWFWHHEWGASHRDDSRGGDDDPYYMQLMFDWYSERAVMNGGLMLGESYFNHGGAPSTNLHLLLDYSTGQIPSYNRRGGLKFKELWGS